MNFRIVAYFMGWILEVEAVSMVTPMIIAIAKARCRNVTTEEVHEIINEICKEYK